MRRLPVIAILAFFWVPLCTLSAASSARADAAERAQADQLFHDGKARLAAGEVSAACEMFGASYKLDPATGSLLALAMCHEREGKLASAVLEYRQLVEGADAKTRADRLEAARTRIEALTPILSTLTIEVEPQPDGVSAEVRLNGQIVPASQLGKAMPLDAGSVLVTASAPNARTFAANLTIAARGASERLRVPVLTTEVAQRPTAAIPIVRPAGLIQSARASAPVRPAPPAAPRALSALDFTGIALLSAGTVTLAAGGLLTLRRIHDNNVSNSGCTPQGCVENPSDTPLRLQGVDKATLVSGAVLTLAGASVLVWERRQRREGSSMRAAFAVPWALPNAGGAVLRGRF